MVGFLGAAFVLIVLLAFVAGTAIMAFLHLMAGKSKAATAWFIAFAVAASLLVASAMELLT